MRDMAAREQMRKNVKHCGAILPTHESVNTDEMVDDTVASRCFASYPPQKNRPEAEAMSCSLHAAISILVHLVHRGGCKEGVTPCTAM